MINNYLNDFRVEACALFKQHQCQQHRPYTCFNWHFANQRRRRPIKKSDGSFNYSPDIYCDKYDENTGICPDGDECLYLHRVSGDVERKYHLRYYKTAQCVHPTDSKGHCMKNGAHCAFAHNNSDLRQPVFDQTHEPAYSSNMENDAKDRTSFVIEDQAWHSQDHVLSCYKTEQCRKPARLCRQGYACPFYHNSKDRRRPPALYKYRSTPCPAAKTVDEWLDPELCEAGDGCQYCHTRTEQQFHPEIYKSTKCNDMLEHGYCPRAVFCAFAHHDSELHITRTPYVLSNSPKEPSSPTAANKCADSSSSMDTSSTHCTIPSYSAVLKQKSVAHSQMNQIHQQNQTTLSTTSPKQIQQQQFAQQTQQQHLHQQQQQQPPPLNINKPQLPSHFQQQQASQAQQIIPMQSTITNMAMESQYAKAPGFERCGPLSPSQDNSELGRNRTQSLNIGPMDIKTKKEYIGSSSGLDTIGTSLPTYSSFPKNENLSRSKDASNLSNTLEELSLDLAQINQHNSQSITELFSGIPCSVPFAGSESFHTSPINNFTDNLFSTNKSNSPSSMFGFENQVAIWEEGLKQARQACEAWRSEAQHYKTKAEHIEMERNRACFERDQLAQQLESLKLHLTSFGNLGLPVSQLSSNQNPNNVLNTQNDFGEIRASNIHMSNAQQSFSMFSNDEEKYFCHRCGRKKDSNSACTFCV